MNLLRAHSALWSLAMLFGPLQRASAQEWIKTSAPQAGWISVASSADGARVVAADASSPFISTSRLVYTSTNAGTTWAATTAPGFPWRGVASSADGLRLAALSGGPDIYLSTNAGAGWTTSALPYPGQSSVATSADGTKLMVAGNGVSISSDFGATWTNTPLAPGNYVLWIACSADGSKLVAEAQGPYSPVYVSTNSGVTWLATGATNDYPGGVAISADGATMVAASYTFDIGGPVFVSTNCGLTWTAVGLPYDYWESVTCSADGTRMAAYGSGGAYLSTNAGATWKASGGRTGWVSKLASSADGCRLVLASQDRAIYTYTVTPAPILAVNPAARNLVLSWIISSMPFSLQRNSDLATDNWSDVPTPPILNYSSLRNEVSVPSPTDTMFYRLQAR